LSQTCARDAGRFLQARAIHAHAIGTRSLAATQRRLFDAPRHLVFEAMTKPEHVKRWWGRLGEGYSVPVCEIDLRLGGKWRFVNRHPKGQAAFHGEYREITPPSRLQRA